MLKRCAVVMVVAVAVLGLARTSPSVAQTDTGARALVAAVSRTPTLKFTTGPYTVSFQLKSGAIEVSRGSGRPALAIHELGGDTASNLLKSVSAIRHTNSTYTLTGKAKWASFALQLNVYPAVPGLLHFRLTVKTTRDVPARAGLQPDIQPVRSAANSIAAYVDAPPVAGTSLFLASHALQSSVLYFANFTALGTYFDRTRSGGGQSFFSYPRAGGEGALVGVGRGGTFGYAPPPSSLSNLPHGKSTPVVDSFLYLLPNIATGEGAIASTYLQLLGTVFQQLPTISLPPADWKTIAAKAAGDLIDPANLVTRNGYQYLRSYVSDTRSSPELITQAGTLAGVRAYENRYHVTLPLDAILEKNLPTYYDPMYHSVKNGLGIDPTAREESWYFVGNMISLLQAAQSGSAAAHTLLLESSDAVIKLAHINNYEFPQNFALSDFNGKDTGLQPDVAGGYSWLMLGLYDLTKDTRYLDEAKASIQHVAGKGFDLTYETHMTGYAAAAAQRLFVLTGDQQYHDDALLALANFFHVTRLWDCTYGFCRQGSGYHTIFGVNILPWGDYIAMREQYESWLALRDYLSYATAEPAYLRNLVQAFVAGTPGMLQYSLPPALPAGDVPAAPGLYSFVHQNNLTWNIPVEDLREGESQSGAIGQEIYGAGGPFWLGAYAP